MRLGPSLLASHYAALYVSFMILYELFIELGILVSRTNHLDVWKNFFQMNTGYFFFISVSYRDFLGGFNVEALEDLTEMAGFFFNIF